MSEYKCINCGEIKESENTCSCTACGYRMFMYPYDRRGILLSEVENFISRLKVVSLSRDDLIFEGKEKDEKRFPDFDRILKYVSERERTEDFLNNLLETAEQLKLHFTSQFSKTYNVHLKALME